MICNSIDARHYRKGDFEDDDYAFEIRQNVDNAWEFAKSGDIFKEDFERIAADAETELCLRLDEYAEIAAAGRILIAVSDDLYAI